METKVNLIDNRLFIKLDDNSWYLVNKRTKTKEVYIDNLGFSILHRDGVEFNYKELKKGKEISFNLRIFDFDGSLLMIDNRITKEVIIEQSAKNLYGDAEGMYIWNWLNHKSLEGRGL